MVNFAEFYNLIPSNEKVELHVIENNQHFDVDNFTLESDDLHYPWYQYSVDTFYSFYDADEKDTKIHALIAYRGEDNNYVEND